MSAALLGFYHVLSWLLFPLACFGEYLCFIDACNHHDQNYSSPLDSESPRKVFIIMQNTLGALNMLNDKLFCKGPTIKYDCY